MSVFFVSRKSGGIKSLKIYQHTTFHGPTFTGASFASISEVWTSTILNWSKLRTYKLWTRGHRQWHDLPTEFHKIYQLVQKLTECNRQEGDRINLLFSLRKNTWATMVGNTYY
jgi:hypothetical protein